ncbi:hypothetical protein H4582DRAFT_1922771 [Lactarius indigo]|nr:hypothetical protein H4582DRAFT_1922771 [Lactarius indigo]
MCSRSFRHTHTSYEHKIPKLYKSTCAIFERFRYVSHSQHKRRPEHERYDCNLVVRIERIFISPNATAIPAGGVQVIGMESRVDTALARQKSDVRYRMMEIEKLCADWRCEEYRKLLERFCEDEGQSTAQPKGAQPIDTGSSSSHSAPDTLSGPTPQQQVPPSLVAREDDGNQRLHHQGTSRSSELVPPRRVRRDNLSLENREVFVGTIAALCADNSLSNRSAIFSAAGLCDHQLAPLEAEWATKTPSIPWLTFQRAFGGFLYSERPTANKIKAYAGSFLCTNKITQPFAPTCVGEPGVILFHPGMVLLEDAKETFHVLVDPSMGRRTELQYYGIYTKVHIPYILEAQPDEWHALPGLCRKDWLKRMWTRGADDVKARSNLRKKSKKFSSELSPAEIQEWLRKYHNGFVTEEKHAIPNSFNSGAEKLGFEVIKCVGYDVKLAKLIQDNASR